MKFFDEIRYTQYAISYTTYDPSTSLRTRMRTTSDEIRAVTADERRFELSFWAQPEGCSRRVYWNRSFGYLLSRLR